ncbi:MAG TPA: HDOD domain-containing protein [Candidatus Acidoferrum sp.]|nr:HDOD domain-containing protein [Candidatus Acidoferrum sp.]
MNESISDNVVNRIQSMETLPTMPTLLQPLLNCIRRPTAEVDVDEVVKLAEQDESIAAQCIRVANSPLFARSRAAGTLREAVFSLGLRRVEDILLSICVSKLLPRERYVVDPIAFWRHSLGCALVARKLAEMIRFNDPEGVYLAGLLHDIGILVNAIAFPKEFEATLEQAVIQHLPLDAVERTVLGFTHSESGAILAEMWKLPPHCYEAIRFHHDLSIAADDGPLAHAALVSLADLFCRVRDMGYGYPEFLRVDFAEHPAWHLLVRRYAELERIDLVRFTFEVSDAVAEVSAVVNLIFPGAPRVNDGEALQRPN